MFWRLIYLTLIPLHTKKIATRKELLLLAFATLQVRTLWNRFNGKCDFYTRVYIGSAYFFKKQLFLIRTKMNREICLSDLLILSKLLASRHNFTQKEFLCNYFSMKVLRAFTFPLRCFRGGYFSKHQNLESM